MGCSHADRTFTFEDAEFMPDEKDEAVARKFIAEQLPVGFRHPKRKGKAEQSYHELQQEQYISAGRGPVFL